MDIGNKRKFKQIRQSKKPVLSHLGHQSLQASSRTESHHNQKLSKELRKVLPVMKKDASPEKPLCP